MDNILENASQRNGPPPGSHLARLFRLLRFVAAGAFNTLASIACYQAALFFMGHLPAYVVAYAAGIIVAYYLYARYVFNARAHPRGFGLFVVFYVAAGFIGGAINTAIIDYAGWHARIAIFATVLLMLPVNYFGSRWCVQRASAPNGGRG